MSGLNAQDAITRLLDIEKDLRNAEACLSSGLRYCDIARNDEWFALMEKIGVLNSGKFLPIAQIIEMHKDHESKVFILESIGADLSEIEAVLSQRSNTNQALATLS